MTHFAKCVSWTVSPRAEPKALRFKPQTLYAAIHVQRHVKALAILTCMHRRKASDIDHLAPVRARHLVELLD